MQIQKIILLHSLLFCFSCYAPQLTITQSGDYVIGGDIPYTPVTNDSIITISSNNVILDLGGRVLSQTNLVAGLTGIIVNPNFSNITIRNGTISNITGTGIGISQGCSLITIDNITTFSCDLRAINVIGTAANLVTNSELKNSSIISCLKGNTSDFAVTFSQCAHFNVTNCKFYGNGNPNNTNDIMHFEETTDSIIQDLTFMNNTAGLINHVDLNRTTQQMIFRNCLINNTTATKAGLSTGFALDSTCTNNLFQNCTFDNSSITSTLIGFNVLGNNNFFDSCKVLNTSGNGLIGFNIQSSSFNLLGNCTVAENTASSATFTAFNFITTQSCVAYDCLAFKNASRSFSIGYEISNGRSCGLIRCIAENCTSVVGTAVGINVDTNPFGVFMQDCAALRNIGSGAATSFGITINVGTGLVNTLIRNLAMNNSTTSANNLSGTYFTANNAQLIAGTATNQGTGTSFPWINFGLTG